jgi:hypothetical protein
VKSYWRGGGIKFFRFLPYLFNNLQYYLKKTIRVACGILKLLHFKIFLIFEAEPDFDFVLLVFFYCLICSSVDFLLLVLFRTVPEPVFLNVYGAQESIPRHQFRQPM